MGALLNEEALGCHFCWHFVSYMQDRPNLSLSDLGHSIEVSWHGCAHTTSIWRITMNSHDIIMEDIFNVSFDTIIGMSNMRYINAQQTTLNHCAEKK